MTLYQTLKKDHKTVKDILNQLLHEKDSMSGAVDNLFRQLEQELAPHIQGEEKFLYPALQENEKAREDIMEAFEEHHAAQLVLEELKNLPKDNERWMAKLTVFKEILDHHIEEEESGIFKMARQILGHEREQDILQRFEQLKHEQMAAAR